MTNTASIHWTITLMGKGKLPYKVGDKTRHRGFWVLIQQLYQSGDQLSISAVPCEPPLMDVGTTKKLVE